MKRIFNYRLSRARKVIKNAILVNRFRVLLNPISLSIDKVELIILACVELHNLLTTENSKHANIDLLDNMNRLPNVIQHKIEFLLLHYKYGKNIKTIFVKKE